MSGEIRRWRSQKDYSNQEAIWMAWLAVAMPSIGQFRSQPMEENMKWGQKGLGILGE